MRHFHTRILGVVAFVEYEYEPAERAASDCPGSDGDAEITSVTLEQGAHRISIDVNDIDDVIYDELRDEAIEDAEQYHD